MDEQEQTQDFFIPGGEVIVTEQPRDTSPVVLRYVGEGGAFVFGVPAADLRQADIDASGLTVDELLAYAGVYARSAYSAGDADREANSD
jgi:hypothetical protein